LSQSEEEAKFMVLATIRMIIPPKKRDEALKILRSMAEQCKIHSGCLACYIYEDVQEENVLMFEEIWGNEEDLTQHIRSREYQNVLLVMEMAPKRPEVRFNTVSISTGMETIEKARSRKGQTGHAGG
jgi:quinol monooxygenase YgiN